MNNLRVRLALIVLVASSFAACKGGDNDSSDAGTSDAGTSDARPSLPILADDIGIDLAQVVSLVTLPGASGQLQQPQSKHGSFGTVTQAVGDEDGPQLFALTLSGEVVSVAVVESSDGSMVAIAQPFFNRIYSTPAWIFFSSMDFSVYEIHDNDPPDLIGCTTLAARRDDGALFCADLGIRDGGRFGSGETVRSNPAGDVVYFISGNALDQDLIYRVHMDGPQGPTALLIDPVLGPQWTAVNAVGDLLVKYAPPGVDPSEAITQIIPVEGGAPFSLDATGIVSAAPGEAGAADEDTFYVLGVVDDGGPIETTITVVTRDGTSFADTPVPIAGLGWEQCHWLHRLADGVYLVCGLTLAKVVEDSTVIASPTLIPFTGADALIEVDGMSLRSVPGFVVQYAGDGASRKFLRHDGITQQDIPIDSNIALLDFGVSPGGTINFLGVTIDTNAKVMGTVPANETEVTILSHEEFDPEVVVAFTPIN